MGASRTTRRAARIEADQVPPVPLGGGRVCTVAAWRAATPDQRVAAIAAVQHGAFARGQARAAGLSDTALAHRVRGAWFRRLHAGVFARAGATLTPDGRRAAALLACGPDASISHADAGEAWAFAALRASPRLVEVTVDPERRVRRAGLVVHRAELRPPDERRSVRGLGITSPARTILDLAPRLADPLLEAVLADARHRRIVRDGELAVALDRGKGRPGVGAVRRLLAREGGPAFTRSAAERLLLPALRTAGVGGFTTNAPVLDYEVDVLWARERLVVEVDGFETHGDRVAFERDRRRDAELTAAGYRVLRFTWRQLEDDADRIVATIRAVLGWS